MIQSQRKNHTLVNSFLSIQGLGLGLGLGLPLAMYIAYVIFQKIMKRKILIAKESGIITKEESPVAHSLTASPSHNNVV